MRVPEDYIMGTSDKSRGCGGSFWFFVISMILVTIGVFTGTMPIILIALAAAAILFTVVLLIISAGKGNSPLKRKKKLPTTWTTPGGSASKLYLDMLEQYHLFVLGSQTIHRDNLRNGLIYTALYKAPCDMSLILLDMVGFWMRCYQPLPHTIGYCHKPDDGVVTLREIVRKIDERLKRYEKNPESSFSTIWVIIDGYDHLLAEHGKEVDNIIQSVLSRGRMVNVHLLLFSAYCKDHGDVDESFPSYACLFGAPSAKIYRATGLKNQHNPVDQVYYRSSSSNEVRYAIPQITDEMKSERIEHWMNQCK